MALRAMCKYSTLLTLMALPILIPSECCRPIVMPAMLEMKTGDSQPLAMPCVSILHYLHPPLLERVPLSDELIVVIIAKQPN